MAFGLERISGSFNRCQGLVAALALVTPFLVASEVRAENGIPEDERYAKLEQVYKNARQNCVLLDKIDETSNRRKSTVRDVIDTISLLPEGRATVERAKAAGVAMCIVGQSDITDVYRSNLDGHYYSPLKAIALNGDLYQFNIGGLVTAGTHEFDHFEYFEDMEKRGEAAAPSDQMTYEQMREKILSTERRAFVAQTIKTWKLGRKQYVSNPFISARQHASGSEIPTAEARRQNVFVQAYFMLDSMAKKNPASIDNGEAEAAVTDLLKKSGYVERNYDRDIFKPQIFKLSDFLARIARTQPEMLTGSTRPLEVHIMNYFDEQKIPVNQETKTRAAREIVRHGKDLALKIAAERPDAIASKQAAYEIYTHLTARGVTDRLCDMIFPVRDPLPFFNDRDEGAAEKRTPQPQIH